MNIHPLDEVITTTCEYLLDMSRSDAQAMVEAMTDERKDQIQSAFYAALKT